MENRIEAQGRNQAHPTAPTGMPEFHDTVARSPSTVIATCGSQRRTTRIIWRAHWAMVLCLSPRRSLTWGVGAGTLKTGKAQQRVVQGGVMTKGQHNPA